MRARIDSFMDSPQFVAQQAGLAGNRAERRAQVVRSGSSERLQLLVGECEPLVCALQFAVRDATRLSSSLFSCARLVLARSTRSMKFLSSAVSARNSTETPAST